MIGPQGRPGGSGQMGDELTNLILIAVGGLLGVAFILRLAGSVAAFLTGTPQPSAGAAGGVAVFFNPGDPGGQLGADGLNLFVYWVVAALMLGALVDGHPYGDGPVARGVVDDLREHGPPPRADPVGRVDGAGVEGSGEGAVVVDVEHEMWHRHRHRNRRRNSGRSRGVSHAARCTHRTPAYVRAAARELVSKSRFSAGCNWCWTT